MLPAMKLLPVIAAACLAAACSKAESPAAPANNLETPPAPAAPAAPAATAFSLSEKNDLFSLEYSYSAEAAAIPKLVDRFQKDIAQIRAEFTKTAAEDRDYRKKEGFDFNGYDSETAYTTAGQSDALLSLELAHSEYTGGAHPNHGTGSILWDRKADGEIKVADLFGAPANRDRLLTQGWCDALNAERVKRRGEPLAADDMFSECPKLDDIAIIPADSDGNGRFDRLRLVASPYVAGPYAEGEYEIVLPVTVSIVAAIREAYRPSFEAAQPAQ